MLKLRPYLSGLTKVIRTTSLVVFGLGVFSGCLEQSKNGSNRRPSGADESPGTNVSITPSPSFTPIPGPSPLPTPLPTPTPVAPVLEEQCHKAEKFICDVELAIARKTNEKRGTSAPLKFSKKLGFASRKWSESQSNRGSIGHGGCPGARMADLRAEFGADAAGVSMAAENVAMTGGSSADAEAVAQAFVTMWWNSGGHRRNMLGRYEAIGVGVVKGRRGSYYATQIFGRGD